MRPFSALGHECLGHGTGLALARLLSLELASRAELRVIGFERMRRFADRRFDVQRIGMELDHPYVVTGQAIGLSFSGDVLVSIRILDSIVGSEIVPPIELRTHVTGFRWLADRDFPEVASTIAAEVRAHRDEAVLVPRRELTPAELVRRAKLGIAALERDGFEDAERDLQEAIALDPGCADALAWLGRLRIFQIGQGWGADRKALIDDAHARLEQARGLDGRNAIALACQGHLLSYVKTDIVAGQKYLDSAIEADQGVALAWSLRSAAMAYRGQPSEALKSGIQAILRSPPNDPTAYYNRFYMGLAHYTGGDYRQAIRRARESMQLNPNYSSTYKLLIASLAAVNQVDEARLWAVRLRALEPQFSRAGDGFSPFQSQQVHKLYVRRLRAADVFDRVAA